MSASRVPPYADAVAALFHRMYVEENGDGTSRLRALSLLVRSGVSPREPFAHQPAGAFGSGFLVAPRLIATAGHCVAGRSLVEIRFVFGYRMIDEAAARLVVSRSDIYCGARVIDLRHEPSGPDWALIELDRDVPDRTPAPIRRAGKVKDGQPLYVLGHPAGLPLKFADGASVRDNGHPSFFTANLDTYRGSSGSPVFGAGHVVEGIVARGDKDFILVGDTYESAVHPDSGGLGETCIRTTEFAAVVHP